LGFDAGLRGWTHHSHFERLRSPALSLWHHARLSAVGNGRSRLLLDRLGLVPPVLDRDRASPCRFYPRSLAARGGFAASAAFGFAAAPLHGPNRSCWRGVAGGERKRRRMDLLQYQRTQPLHVGHRRRKMAGGL